MILRGTKPFVVFGSRKDLNLFSCLLGDCFVSTHALAPSSFFQVTAFIVSGKLRCLNCHGNLFDRESSLSTLLVSFSGELRCDAVAQLPIRLLGPFSQEGSTAFDHSLTLESSRSCCLTAFLLHGPFSKGPLWERHSFFILTITNFIINVEKVQKTKQVTI